MELNSLNHFKDHSGIIPVKFDDNPPCRIEGDVV